MKLTGFNGSKIVYMDILNNLGKLEAKDQLYIGLAMLSSFLLARLITITFILAGSTGEVSSSSASTSGFT